MKKILGKICDSLGRNNDAVYAVLAIAVFKGVFRPLFTMMDKKQSPESKKYAAFREGLTEVIAFCSYLGTAALIKTLSKPLCKKNPINVHKIKSSLSFLGVCLSAFLVIPAVCNLSLKPIMKKFDRPKSPPSPQLTQLPRIYQPHIKVPIAFQKIGPQMRVGGL